MRRAATILFFNCLIVIITHILLTLIADAAGPLTGMIISLSKLLLLPVAVVAMNARLSSSAGALWFITVTCLSVLALLAGHLFAFNYRVEPADVNYAEELYWYQSFMLFNLIEVIGLSIPVVIIQYFYRRERSS